MIFNEYELWEFGKAVWWQCKNKFQVTAYKTVIDKNHL